MAKSSKPKSNSPKSDDTKAQSPRIDEGVEDAVEVDTDGNAAPADEEKSASSLADDVPVDAEDGDSSDKEEASEALDDPVAPTGDGRATDLPAVAPAPDRDRPASIVPLVLGGVIAGAIGYGIATFFPLGSDQQTAYVTARLDDQAASIADLRDRLDSMPEPDLSALDGRIDQLAEAVPAQIDAAESNLSEQLAAFDTRLTELEKQPNADGTLSDTALAAYQQELDALRAELAAQQEDVMSAAAQAEADLAAARAEAEALEQEAVAAAEAAAARAALNRISAAVETGAPFEDALSDLDDADVPPALSAAAPEGVATTAELVADFPATARAALATARSEGVSDDAGGLGGFLRSQFDVRSTAPREGSGPDAVLSRAEAAVKQGRIADALAELEALPEVARAEMTDWTARATERAEVLNAISTLSETYN